MNIKILNKNIVVLFSSDCYKFNESRAPYLLENVYYKMWRFKIECSNGDLMMNYSYTSIRTQKEVRRWTADF